MEYSDDMLDVYKNIEDYNLDKLVEKCIENIDGNRMLYNETLDVIPLGIILLNSFA